MKRWVESTNSRDKSYVVIASGANMNFDSLRFVSERADSRETLLKVEIPEAPGAFRRLISHLEPRNVTEFSYRYNNAAKAVVHLTFQGRGAEDVAGVLSGLEQDGCAPVDLTANELAKAHTRHMAGGRSSVANEHVYRFEFPERPGALSNFLDSLNAGWNVSLFHYRNHGSDVRLYASALHGTVLH